MALNSAMYAAVTGLSALGTGMQTISNNIANVNTVGFKAGRTNYEDLISQNYFSGGSGRANQRGTGVKVSSIQSIFSQGAFMQSAQDTDMAIAGEGFFAVRNVVTGATNYTRAGVFTLTKDGLMEDPSGNILQGWQMSIPKPGQEAVKIGAPTDIKITVLNAPPVQTSQMKVVVNLNAKDEPAFLYKENQLAHEYADPIAKAAASASAVASALAVWSAACTTATYAAGTVTPGLKSDGTPSEQYAIYFLEAYNAEYGPPNYNTTPSPVGDPVDELINQLGPNVVPDGTSLATWQLTEADFTKFAMKAEAQMVALADQTKRDKYSSVYQEVYQDNVSAISWLDQWKLEGNGFAKAWNAQESPYIDPENYTHMEPITIYDSLGNDHNMYIYFQKNPHMDNVWDYIICCDPLEDARKDSNNRLLFDDTASFSGLVQKGKITFTASGDDRHGGMIKDIEAQNLDLSKTKMASIEAMSGATTATMINATVGGYFVGSPAINPSTGVYESTPRKYTVSWAGNIANDPPTSGFTWTDGVESGFIPIHDRNHAGPYEFGSGMTLTFDTSDTPLSFTAADTFDVTVHSEQMAWTNIEPNKEGYFDFDVAFVQSASMALHPPYPEGMPTMIQNIALDLGARNPYGLATEWKLDEQSTTQYATKSSTVFNGQDGYPAGSLQRVSIGEDGVVTGIYTNGRHQPLYQVALTRFMNPWGLNKIGDNLFEETRYSGAGAMNEPGYGGTGTVLANFLEQSNVDIAEEIVNMIITQRGFQANSKTVTTTDTMLAEVIEMKR
ncbi:flagellar hook-basal body complex protein [Deltaproteobacteria bacterium OttesenSCG-928-M10]|nr:flagellar hook-basal body complex protein [Deltaproteobacteria bacterium OttesenSCG-928-M10]